MTVDRSGREFRPNGVEVSRDGRWYFMNSWATRTFIRLSRGQSQVRRDRLPDFLPDNAKIGADGRVLITGQVSTPATVFAGFNDEDICSYPLVVLRIDPETLAVEEVLRAEHDVFGTASTALGVNGELWISSPRSDRIASVARRDLGPDA